MAPARNPILYTPAEADHSELLQGMLQRPNIASKETWVRQYDHEVIAQTAIKPFVGVERDGPGDAGVIAPIHGDPHGLVISCGIAPRYSDIDAGAMAAARTTRIFSIVACGSPATGETSMGTSPPTAYWAPSGQR